MSVMSRLIPVVAVAAAVAGASPSLGAQKAERASGPEQGTWGAEGSLGLSQSATLIHFESAKWALLAGAQVSHFTNSNPASSDLTITSVTVGARRYGRSGLGFRPAAGAGLIVNSYTGNATQVGVYGEVGANYFFTPHLSLGVLGNASFTGGGGQKNISANLARLTAAVFF